VLANAGAAAAGFTSAPPLVLADAAATAVLTRVPLNSQRLLLPQSCLVFHTSVLASADAAAPTLFTPAPRPLVLTEPDAAAAYARSSPLVLQRLVSPQSVDEFNCR